MIYGIHLNPAIGSCVFKLIYQDKYLIVKAKSMPGSAQAIQIGLNQFLRDQDGQKKPTNLYIHLYEHVKAHPGGQFSHGMIKEGEMMAPLDAAQYEALMAQETARGDSKELVKVSRQLQEIAKKANKNALELLKAEQRALDAGRNDPACLNNNVLAYIPDYNDETGMYGWIRPGAVLNFKNWLKTRAKKPANRKSVKVK